MAVYSSVIDLSLLVLFATLAHSISPIEIKGAKLFTAEDGNQFFIKGVAYQRAGSNMVIDPLIDTSQCELDAGLMAAIGVNTIRVYTTAPTGDHDGCMEAFASRGIYVWIDLASPTYSINRADPEYTMELFDRFSGVIDAFSQYNNTLSFTAANEMINDEDTISVAPYIKAVVRDLKAFRDARGYRMIPISYTSADVSNLQLPTKNYLSCGDESDTIEMFGMNVYSWCGNSSYGASGYDKVYTQFQDTSIPGVFAETGCTTSGPRTFGEVAAILGSVFPATFSGVIVYEWPQELNDYGLVEYPNDDGTGFPSTRAGYNNLGRVYTTASPVSTAMTAYTPSNSPPACPSSNSDWPVAGTDTQSISNLSENAEGQAGLSTGAIAGIAVGGAVVGIAFALLAFFLLRRRRKQARQTQNGDAAGSYGTVDSDDIDAFHKAELPGGSANSFVGKQELHSDTVHEADGVPKVHEMEPGYKRHVYEMPGTGPPELEGTGGAREMK